MPHFVTSGFLFETVECKSYTRTDPLWFLIPITASLVNLILQRSRIKNDALLKRTGPEYNGTAAFVAGIPVYGTLIGLAWRGQPYQSE